MVAPHRGQDRPPERQLAGQPPFRPVDLVTDHRTHAHFRRVDEPARRPFAAEIGERRPADIDLSALSPRQHRSGLAGVVRDSQSPHEIAARAAGKYAQRRPASAVGEKAVGDLADRPVAADGDHHLVAAARSGGEAGRVARPGGADRAERRQHLLQPLPQLPPVAACGPVRRTWIDDQQKRRRHGAGRTGSV